MMTLLDKYIGRSIATSILLALLVLVSLDMLFALVRELDEIGQGEYSFTEAMLYLGLTTPHRIYQYFPVATLLGAIAGLGVLASNSELTVIRAAGVSVTRIVGSILKTGAVMMLAVFLLSEFVIPVAEQTAETRRALKLAEQSALKSEYGFWSRDGYSFINIRDIAPGGQIANVYLYEFDSDYRLRRATHAGRARYDNGQWLLENIVQSDISENRVTQSMIDKARWDSLLAPGLLNIVVIDPARMPVRELFAYIRFLRANNQDAERYSLAMWSKIMTPLAIAVMLLLAVPFVFGPLRSVAIGPRILVGFLVGLAFYIINKAFGYLGVVYAFSPVLSATLPVLLFLAGALFMLRRI
ncbi:MAG: LPS export ABC transporter permease LptG [Granulosicoccaceae bacterium]|jgi:lipopolysaccharide export system permease protein